MNNDDPWCKEMKYTSDEQMAYCMQLGVDFRSQVYYILFEGWAGFETSKYVGGLFLMFFLAFVIETVPFIRWYLRNKDENKTTI